MTTFLQDRLQVRIFPSRADMGRACAQDIAHKMLELLSVKPEINMIFAAAPSQNEVLENLCALDLPWKRVNAFHMDEYLGLPDGAPQRFSSYLNEHIFSRVPFRSVHTIDALAQDAANECARYAELLRQYPVDITCAGIGENGHLAFNDPPVADFSDPALVKPVTLDETCRMQQVHDGCFPTLSAVPKTALTLTIPALFSSGSIFCAVPGKTKANAVRETLTGAITEACPASILRRHENAVLYLDCDSASLLPEQE